VTASERATNTAGDDVSSQETVDREDDRVNTTTDCNLLNHRSVHHGPTDGKGQMGNETLTDNVTALGVAPFVDCDNVGLSLAAVKCPAAWCSAQTRTCYSAGV